MIVQHELHGAQLHQLSNTAVCTGGVKEAAESAENLSQGLQSTFWGKTGRELISILLICSRFSSMCLKSSSYQAAEACSDCFHLFWQEE